MAPHSSTLAWKIPWMEEPGRLQSMGSLRVGHNWATSLSLFTFMHWRRKWQPTPVFLPRESQRWGSLVGCHLWGRTESDTTEATYQHQQQPTKSLTRTKTKKVEFILPDFTAEKLTFCWHQHSCLSGLYTLTEITTICSLTLRTSKYFPVLPGLSACRWWT